MKHKFGNAEQENYKLIRRSDGYKVFSNPQSYGDECSQPVKLEKFNTRKDVNNMFFIETSGRDHITPREACAIESGAKFSNLHVNVLMTSDYLNLQDNTTCYIYKTVDSVTFFAMKDSLGDIYRGTPLENFHRWKEFKNSPRQMMHLSDSLRSALLYKNGGFYSDMDAITLKDLSQYKTIFSVANTYGDVGGRVSNSAFKIERQHRLLWHNMENIKKIYTGADERNEIGPKIMSLSVMELYNLTYLNMNLTELVFKDLTLMNHIKLHPLPSNRVADMWSEEELPEDYWENFLKDSLQLHTSSSHTNVFLVQGDQRHEAYAYIGPKFCPVAYKSFEYF